VGSAQPLAAPWSNATAVIPTLDAAAALAAALAGAAGAAPRDAVDALVLGDVASLVGYGGFWRMAMTHGRTGLFEMYRSFVKSAFVRAVQELVPEVQSEDLVPGRAGVRAQAVEPSGALVDDFRIIEQSGMLHVLNAPSPAATASLAIGKHIASAATRVFRDARLPRRPLEG
jgi:L-2-hydroxyglutarate oxidase LhgO